MFRYCNGPSLGLKPHSYYTRYSIQQYQHNLEFPRIFQAGVFQPAGNFIINTERNARHSPADTLDLDTPESPSRSGVMNYSSQHTLESEREAWCYDYIQTR